MTKDEYEDFVLRYKGCGACFPIYHTLSRFEKMWFTAIQKDVAELEKENAELKETVTKMNNVITETFSNLTQAKELLKKIEKIVYNGENEIKRLSKIVDILAEAEQFLKELNK